MRTFPEKLGTAKNAVLAVGLVTAGALWAYLGDAVEANGTDSLAHEGRNLTALFVIVLALWISEVIPLAVTSLAIFPLLVLIGIADAHTAMPGFASPVFMFVLFALPVAFTASCAFLLPLDPVCLLTYSRGYYRMHDMVLPGTLISVCWVVFMTLVMTLVAPWVRLV